MTSPGDGTPAAALNLNLVPLEQVPVLPPGVLEPMLQRVLPGSSLVLSQDTGFSSHI